MTLKDVLRKFESYNVERQLMADGRTFNEYGKRKYYFPQCPARKKLDIIQKNSIDYKLTKDVEETITAGSLVPFVRNKGFILEFTLKPGCLYVSNYADAMDYAIQSSIFENFNITKLGQEKLLEGNWIDNISSPKRVTEIHDQIKQVRNMSLKDIKINIGFGNPDKKLIGYACPYSMFNGVIPEGTIYVNRTPISYRPKGSEFDMQKGVSFDCCDLPREIVEKLFTKVYEQKYKVGDYLVHIPENKIVRIESIDHDLIHTVRWNGVQSHFDMNDKDYRLATSLEKATHTDKTCNVGSNGKVVRIYCGRILSHNTEYYPKELQAKIDGYISMNGQLSGRNFELDANIRFIRIGCATENNMFSINEIRNIINIANSQI